MRWSFAILFLLAVLCCVGASGCGLWQDQAREVESTGHGVLLFPTSAEERAGYR